MDQPRDDAAEGQLSGGPRDDLHGPDEPGGPVDPGGADGAGGPRGGDAVGGDVEPDDHDDLDDVHTAMSRLGRGARRLIAAAIALALLVPAGTWLADELDFRRSGAAVVATVEGELSGSDAGATVLLIRTVGCGGAAGSGSAFVVETPRGPALVTNRHVVERATQVALRSLDGEVGLRVRQIRTATDADVAVLDVAEPWRLPPPLQLRTTPVEVGEPVRVVGFPAARPFTDAGEVVQSRPEGMLLDLDVAPGASGSPVVDDQGQVVGQVRAVTSEGLGLATPSQVLSTAIADARPHDPGC